MSRDFWRGRAAPTCSHTPDLFGALASHAGDAFYELCYLAEFGKVVRHLRDYDGDINRWWADFRSRTAFTKPRAGVAVPPNR